MKKQIEALQEASDILDRSRRMLTFGPFETWKIAYGAQQHIERQIDASQIPVVR